MPSDTLSGTDADCRNRDSFVRNPSSTLNPYSSFNSPNLLINLLDLEKNSRALENSQDHTTWPIKIQQKEKQQLYSFNTAMFVDVKQECFDSKADTAVTPSNLTNSNVDEQLRAIAYSMDILSPGFYIWFGRIRVRIGGCSPDDTPYKYPGTIKSRSGIALVLPGYRIFTTYQGTYDPRQTSDTGTSLHQH